MNIIWVAKTGNDTTGTGTESNPYLTINKAVSVFVSGDQIRICDGEYNETDAIVLSGVNGSIIAASGKQYDEDDIDPVVKIKPTSLALSNAIIHITNSTRFDIKGLYLEQATNASGNQFGIKLEGSTNVHIQNCVVKNFDCTGASYCVGIFGNSATYGCVENCVVDNLSCDGMLVGGIIGNVSYGFDVFNCKVGEEYGIIGENTCSSYGIGNPTVLDPKIYALIFGFNQLTTSTWEQYHAIYEKNHNTLDEYLNNEIGLTIINNPIDSWTRADAYPVMPNDPGWPWVGAQYTWLQNVNSYMQATSVIDNGGVTHVYLLYQTHLANGVVDHELLKIRHWRNDTNTWTDEVIPSTGAMFLALNPSNTSSRLLRGCIEAKNINGTIYIVATCCAWQIRDISSTELAIRANTNAPAYFFTFVYNGSSWSAAEYHGNYSSGGKPRTHQYQISIFEDGSHGPLAYLSYVDQYTSTGTYREITILKLNFNTKIWSLLGGSWANAHVIKDTTGGYITHGFTITKLIGTYDNLYVLGTSLVQGSLQPPNISNVRQQTYLGHSTNETTWTWSYFSTPAKSYIFKPPNPTATLMPHFVHFVSDNNILCLAQNIPIYGPYDQYPMYSNYFGRFMQYNGATWSDRTSELAALPGYDATNGRMYWKFTGLHYYDADYYILTSNSPYIYIYRDGVWTYKALHVESGSDADPATWYNSKGHSVCFCYKP